MGKMFLLEHIVFEYNREQEQLVYRVYVTDRLKAINDSVVHYLGGTPSGDRFYDIVESMKGGKVQEETRTADEIISSISEKLKKVGEDERIRTSSEVDA